MRNNNKRPRGRQQSNKRPVNPKFQNFDSNGPDGRVRGNAQQVYEKYISLAKDCTDDPVLAENFYQHAEHYHRILQAAQEWENQRREERGGDNNRQRNNRGRDDRNDAQSNQNDDQQGDNTENSDASSNNDDTNTPVEAENASADASEEDGGKPKRAPRARRSDARGPGRGRPRKSDDANADENAPAEASGDDTAANADDADQGEDGEKKPRRAAGGAARTRGRHPTARRGRSRAAGREDEEGATSDEGSEPVSA